MGRNLLPPLIFFMPATLVRRTREPRLASRPWVQRLAPHLPVGPVKEASLRLVVGRGFFRSAVNTPLGGSHPLEPDLMGGGGAD